MTIDLSGLSSKLNSLSIPIFLDPEDSVYRLCNQIPWEKAHAQILPDLQKTKKGMWWVGRKINIRKHLGAYVLQCLYNKTDRAMAADLRVNGLFRAFCGATFVEEWSAPHWTKIEEFRNRISRDNHHALGELILALAHKCGYCDPSWADVDSTVQEANMSYPSDARLMVKLTEKASKAVEELKKVGFEFADVALGKIRAKAKQYFFETKKLSQNLKKKVFKELHSKVVEEIAPFVERAMEITTEEFEALPKRVQVLTDQVCKVGVNLLQQVKDWIQTGIVASGKIMSFTLSRVKCVRKGKLGKPNEFGAVYHLARLGGNFMMILKALACVEPDKAVLPRVVYAHRHIFGKGALKSCGSDRGYYSSRNMRALRKAKVQEIAIQSPGKILYRDNSVNPEREAILFNRRAGIEPLIGHVKQGGLSRSRMKSDATAETSAYRTVAGFNLRQILRADTKALKATSIG
jgi:transposase, IS5 family